MAMVRRDPFAREELHREEQASRPGGCDWCGGENGRGNLYRFSVETDGGRTRALAGLFCSVGCLESFNE